MAHPLNWKVPTSIIYGEKDNLTSLETIRAFAEEQGATLTVMKVVDTGFIQKKK